VFFDATQHVLALLQRRIVAPPPYVLPQVNPRNSVVAFKDNSSAIRGAEVSPVLPLNPGGPSALAPQVRTGTCARPQPRSFFAAARGQLRDALCGPPPLGPGGQRNSFYPRSILGCPAWPWVAF
jgi:hypothetical protein